jgi:hypothetical protein
MRIQNMAGAAPFYHIAPRATQQAFMMQIEQLPVYYEYALSRLGYT